MTTMIFTSIETVKKSAPNLNQYIISKVKLQLLNYKF